VKGRAKTANVNPGRALGKGGRRPSFTKGTRGFALLTVFNEGKGKEEGHQPPRREKKNSGTSFPLQKGKRTFHLKGVRSLIFVGKNKGGGRKEKGGNGLLLTEGRGPNTCRPDGPARGEKRKGDGSVVRRADRKHTPMRALALEGKKGKRERRPMLVV